LAQQDAFNGVLESDLPREFAELADVVENDRRSSAVAVERGNALRRGRPGAEADDMLQQSAQPGVMKLLGGRGLPVVVG